MSSFLDVARLRVREVDVPEPFKAVVREGWTVECGAQLLTALKAGYAGSGCEDFSDVVHYEATVNGRGMIDYDLPTSGATRTEALLRRSLGYACMALQAVPVKLKLPIFAYVCLSEGGLEGDLVTANVTFCSDRVDLPRYVDDVDFYTQEALLELSAADATVMLMD